MPRGKKKLDSNKIDVSEIAIADAARETAEMRLRQVQHAPFNPALFEGLLGQLDGARKPLIEARDAALARAIDTINARCNPVLDIYTAIARTLQERLKAGT